MYSRRSPLSLWLTVVLLLSLSACSDAISSAPPEMSVVNQSNGVDTRVSADSWCVDGLFTDACVAVDGPVKEVVASCDDRFVVSLPDRFSPKAGGPLAEFPAEGDGAWPVDVEEGTIIVRADGSGEWSEASWTFELIRSNEGC